jgi:hypothetical protein
VDWPILTIIVAPAIFQAAPHGRVAGRTFGLILKRFHRLGWGCGAGNPRGWALRYAARLGQETLSGRKFSRYLLGLLMLILSLQTGVVIARRLEKLRREMGGGIDQIPAEDPRRVEFNRLHRPVNGTHRFYPAARAGRGRALWYSMRGESRTGDG